MSDELSRGKRITAERAGRKLRDVLDRFVVPAEISTTVDGRVLLTIEPGDVDRLDEAVGGLQAEADYAERLIRKHGG